jgi:phenylalanyl-tRNA synthetase beta subunit
MMTISQKQKWVTCDYAVTEDLVKKIVERLGYTYFGCHFKEEEPQRWFSRIWSGQGLGVGQDLSRIMGYFGSMHPYDEKCREVVSWRL